MKPITVVETPQFLSATRKLLDDVDMPLFALTAFSKNERADLSQRDRNDFKRLTGTLVVRFKEGNG